MIMDLSKVIIDMFDSGCGTLEISKSLDISKKDLEKIYSKEIKNFIGVERWYYKYGRIN